MPYWNSNRLKSSLFGQCSRKIWPHAENTHVMIKVYFERTRSYFSSMFMYTEQFLGHGCTSKFSELLSFIMPILLPRFNQIFDTIQIDGWLQKRIFVDLKANFSRSKLDWFSKMWLDTLDFSAWFTLSNSPQNLWEEWVSGLNPDTLSTKAWNDSG